MVMLNSCEGLDEFYPSKFILLWIGIVEMALLLLDIINRVSLAYQVGVVFVRDKVDLVCG